MDFATLCRRIAEVRSAGKTDPEKAHGLEDALYRDLLRAIADQGVADPAGFAVVALETQNFDFARWAA